MNEAWSSSEPLLRLCAFVCGFVLMAVWELVGPWRAVAVRRARRWTTHLALAALGALVVRVVLPAGAVGVAWVAERQGWGVLRLFPLPAWGANLVALLALDLAIYGQHALFHFVPWLWRFHRIHHADEHLDASTGVRFHPGEALMSVGWKAAVIVILGAAPTAVFVFEVVLNLSSLFNHGNVSLPRRLEPFARWLVVTPAMHRIHHSSARAEHDSNFGFSFPWWDRIFGTYRARAAAGEQIRFGLAELSGEPTVSLAWSLGAPFAAPVASFNRGGNHVDPDDPQ